MASPRIGTCHICGAYGELTFEHVPPQSAFNMHRILQADVWKLISRGNLDEPRGRIQQRGSGAFTLCKSCNSRTGSWYGTAYAEWARQAMSIIIGTRGQPSLMYPFNLFPLRVLKQVVCMFFSINGPSFQEAQPDLARFVLNRESREFADHVRIYAFYTFGDRSRAAGISGLIKGLGTIAPDFHTISEITFPPFGFVMALGSHKSPDPRLEDISGFSAFEYKDWRVGISMRLPIMPIYTAYPGDYRTREQTLSDADANKRRMADHLSLYRRFSI